MAGNSFATARSALQTGRYPTETGCYRNSIPLPRSERTLAHHFNDAGYRTGYIGKWHLAENEPVPAEERVSRWADANADNISRALTTLGLLAEDAPSDLATLTVVLRQIRTVVRASAAHAA